MSIRRFAGVMILFAGTLFFGSDFPSSAARSAPLEDSVVTFTTHIAPVIKKYCRPCHDAESDNESGLSMDNYELVLKGGKHGASVVPGKPDESNLYLKLLPDPTFGKRMPRSKKVMTPEEIKLVYKWIEQGAKKE
jgi:hypothetical protein